MKSPPKRSAPGTGIAGAAKLRLLAAYQQNFATQLGSGTQRKGARP